MRLLVLVERSLPSITSGVESADWQLSPEGVRRCGPLAVALARYLPAVISCSAEPKAEQTARLVGGRLGASPNMVPGLHEHDVHWRRVAPPYRAAAATVPPRGRTGHAAATRQRPMCGTLM